MKEPAKELVFPIPCKRKRDGVEMMAEFADDSFGYLWCAPNESPDLIEPYSADELWMHQQTK